MDPSFDVGGRIDGAHQIIKGSINPEKLAEFLRETFGPNAYQVEIWRTHTAIRAPRNLSHVRAM
jgi:hypothetical protein